MPNNRVETHLPVDVVFEPGKVINVDQIRKLVEKTIRQLDMPEMHVKTKLKVDPSITDISSLIHGIQGEVDKALKSELSPTSHLQKLDPKTLRSYRDTFRGLNTIVAQHNQVLSQTKFQSEDFRKAYELWTAGRAVDPKTNKILEVNEATVASLKNIKNASKEPLFNSETVRNIKLYESELRKLRSTIIQVENASRNIVSVNPLHPTNEGYVLGQKAAKSKPIPAYLTANADAIQEDVKATQKGYRSRLQIAEAEEKRLADLQRKYARRTSELRAQAERSDKEVRKEAQKRLQKRRDQATDYRGTRALTQIRRGAILGVKQYEDAVFSLNKKLENTNRHIDRISASKSNKYASQLEGLTSRANALSAELVKVKRAKQDAAKPLSQTTLRNAGLGRAEVNRRVLQRNAIQEGRKIFQRSGGFGGTFSIAKKDLALAADYHKAKVQQIERVQSRLNMSTERGQRIFNALRQPLFNHARDLEHARDRMRSFGSATQQASALLRQFFRYAIGYGALYQVLAAVRSLTAGVLDLDNALKGIQAVTQATATEMKIIENGIKAVATETQFNTREIAEAAQILGQAGVIPGELPSALRATALFASATGSAIQLSADLVTSMRNVFSTLGDESIANQLTQAINISKLTAADLKTIISLSSQIAKSYNLSTEQYLAAVTTLRNAGIKPSTVATGLRQGLIEIFSPDSKTIKALKTRYKQLGEELSGADIRDKFFAFQLTDNPLISALRELKRLGFTGEGKKVFQRAYDIRAENAISALINNLEQVEAAAGKLTFGNAAARAAQTQMESLTHSLENLGAAISVLAHDVSGGLVSSFEEAVDSITDGVKALTEFNLKLEQAKGYGVGTPALASAVAGIGAASLFKGGIPGKAIVGTGAGITAFKASTGALERQIDQEGARNAAESIWGKIVDVAGTAFAVLSPLIVLELINKLRKKGSPLLDDALKTRNAAGVQRYYGAEKADAVKGAIGKRLAAIKASSGPIGRALALLGAFFAAPIWKKISALVRPLTGFLKKHPIVLFLLSIELAFETIVRLTNFFSKDDRKDLEKKLKAAERRRDRANQAVKQRLDDSAEYRFSTKAYTAKEGTTAASIEQIERDIKAYTKGLREYFGENAENIDELTQKLLKLIDAAPEDGSAEAIAAYDELEKSLDKNEISQLITPDRVKSFGYEGRRIINYAKSLRENIARLLISIEEQGENVSEADATFIEAYKILTQGDPSKEALVFGKSVGNDPIQFSKNLIEWSRKFFETREKLLSQTSEVVAEQQEQMEAATAALDDLINTMQASPSKEALERTIKNFGGKITSVTDETIAYFDNFIEQIEAEIELTLRRLRQIPALKAQIADLEKQRKEVGGRQGRDLVIRDIDERLRVVRAQLKSVLGSQTSDTGRLFSLLNLKRTKVEQQNEAAAVLRADRKKEAEAFAKDITAKLDRYFGPEAKGYEQQAFKNVIINTGEEGEPGTRRAAYEEISKAIAEGTLLQRIAPDEKGGARIPASWTDLQSAIDSLNNTLTKRAQEAEAAGYENLPQYVRIEEAKAAISEARAAKNYELLTTPDKLKNLHQLLLAEQEKDIRARRRYLQNNPADDVKGEIQQKKDLYKLDQELKRLRIETQTNIVNDRIKAADQRLKDFDTLHKTEMKGYKLQLARAIDAGLIKEAEELDQKIIDLKKQRADLELAKLIASGKASKETIENFIADSTADQIEALSIPATARRVLSGVQRRLKKDSEPRTSDIDYVEGLNRQQNVVTSIDQRQEKRADNIRRKMDEIAAIQEYVDKKLSSGDLLPEQIDALDTFTESLRKLREELGALQGEALDESTFGNLGYQLEKGFDLSNAGNKISLLDSAIGNLGNTIQDDIVNGIDGIAGGFADALVAGESFTKGLRQGFAMMLRQIASDIIKSQVLRFMTMIFGSGFMPFAGGGTVSAAPIQEGLKRGGPIEAKASGGEIGGVISGAGTGTSDSIYGAVTTASGKVVRGIRVSDGEGIVNAKAMKALGRGFLDRINTANATTLKAIRKGAAAFRHGGSVGYGISTKAVAAGALRGASLPPLMMASGGMVRDMYDTTQKMKTAGASSTVEHNFQTSVNIQAAEDTGIDADTLRRLDDGINLRIQSYVEDQLRPGGLLQSARGGARR